MKRWKKGRRNGQWREGTREEGAWKDSHWMIKGQNISSDSVRPRYGNQNQCTRCGLCFGANIPHRKSRISCAKQPGRPQCPFVLFMGVDPRSSVMPFSPFFPRSEVRFFFVGRFFLTCSKKQKSAKILNGEPSEAGTRSQCLFP